MTTPAPNDAARDVAIREIAERELLLETLEERKRDCLDFHDLGVLSIRAALTAAYEAGREAGRKAERRRRTPTRCDCPACGRRIDINPLT